MEFIEHYIFDIDFSFLHASPVVIINITEIGDLKWNLHLVWRGREGLKHNYGGLTGSCEH